MPASPRTITRRIHPTIERLSQSVYTHLIDLNIEAWVTPEPVPYPQRRTGEHKILQPGETWGALWDCAWFHFTGTVPAEATGQQVVLLIDLSGEGCVVDSEGTPYLGLTTLNSEFDFSLGEPGKRVVPFAASATGGESVDLWVEAGNNDLFGRLRNNGSVKEARIAIRRENVQALLYDFEVLSELLDFLPPNRARHAQVVQALYEASILLDGDLTDAKVAAASARLASELGQRGGDPALTVRAVGHAHIDLAWLWPLRETIRKGARTFATVLRMMERYPEYVFGASQPQLYQWMKDHYPALYTQIKQRIAEGRWEVQGAMWVEPDANVPGGESLVRQLLYGKRFFRAEFGIDVKNLWLPDVFGYCGSLPQILAKADVSYFLTQKLSWNEFNTYPHNTFHWEGIDGSRVLVHMPPENTYNSSAAPRAVARAEDYYRDKAVSDSCLLLFGIGDGGGGPGEEHLERLTREKDLQGLAPVVQEPAAVFFERLAQRADRYATWRGELYLEKHQGTLTSQARNKRYNRKLEIALRELELSAAQAFRLSGQPYPAEALERIWREILLLQFHDILPGSSITRVYTESLARYAALTEEVAQLTARADRGWLGEAGETRLALNSLSWDRAEWRKIEGDWKYLSVPALSVAAIEATAQAVPPVAASSHTLENTFLRAEFDAEGALVSLFDKEHQREILREGQVGNRLAVYADPGDAWDFADDYDAIAPESTELVATEAWIDGPQAILKQTRRYNASTLTQHIRLTAGSRRLEFETHVDWQENGKMLRALFPVAVNTDSARCEIQFGNIARPTTANTSWEMAKSEICAHKWLDLSDNGYGVALLNDCKYGYCIQGNILNINLLRSPSHPDPVADRAEHTFTYALLPHAGDYIQGNVVREAYELNVPLRLVHGSATVEASASLLQVDATGVIVETVKKAEDSDASIVRLYEAHGATTRTRIQFGFPVGSVALVNLMEEQDKPLDLTENSVEIAFRPFEIVSLKVVPQAWLSSDR